MTTESIVLTRLEAVEGMLLTNGESWGKVVYLGVNDSPENWREVPEEEFEAAMVAEGEAETGQTGEAEL